MGINCADNRKEIVNYFLSKNILVSDDFLEKIGDSFDKEKFYDWMCPRIKADDFTILDYSMVEKLNMGSGLVFSEFESLKPTQPNPSINNEKNQEKKGQSQNTNFDIPTSINVLFSYNKEPKKKEIMDFVCLFNKRYEAIRRILMNRQDMQSATSISRLIGKKDKSICTVIGSVLEKTTTANHNIMLTLEDQTGTIKVFLGKNKQELVEANKELVIDDVIGVTGTNGDGIIFANIITYPDLPAHKEIKKSEDKCYAVFLSDMHVGSDTFLEDEFMKFLQWIRMESGNEKQKEIASKVGYIFIIGDLVDGIGIYPEQDSELVIKDIYQQYDECARFLKQIPEHIKIIICPGNHDALRISEPQPCLNADFAKSLWEMKNVTMVSNPAFVNIHASKDFSGFDVLMYHGYSFDYYVANVDAIREKGGYDRADLIMKFLLKRRHLAPAYSSTLYVTDPEKDPLVIEKVPDFFVTGHIHKSHAANYKNITMICGSCWQSKTSFQEKVGHNPEPARVPIVDLNTRQVKILRFDKASDKNDSE
ncbi:MAG: DNA-directed DNA polymerase II small subunit [Candidatus Woesearchaeota archaeon]|nr:DNA-directed DNA polymerase II small subunit [Candidatus Woesearchaeota archaeon]